MSGATLSASQIDAYAKHGYLVLDSLLTESRLEQIRGEILATLAEIEIRKADDIEYRKISRYRRFTVGLHLKNPAIREYVLSARFQEIGRAFIGDQVDLSGTSTVTKSPGKSRSIDWHQDLVYDPKKDISQIICWTSVTASHPENGGLFVFPGSHKLGLIPHEKSEWYERDLRTLGVEPDKAAPLFLEKGQMVVLHPLVIHGSSENATDGDRIALLGLYRAPRQDLSEAEAKNTLAVLRA